MAKLNGVFFSDLLKRSVHFTAVLSNDNAFINPDDPYYKRPVKNVYLLHGYCGVDTDWSDGAPLGEIANRFNVNFFMPSGENSFYLDRPETGSKYAHFVGEEFVEYTRKTFGLSDKREDTIIGGLSMGGFGALHTALMFNETFSKTIALSSALIHNEVITMRPEDGGNSVANYEYYNLMFGNPAELANSINNPEVLVKNIIANKGVMPDIYMAIGTEDFLLQPNRDMKAFLESQNVKFTYEEGPGVHDMNFWRVYLVKGLEWALQ